MKSSPFGLWPYLDLIWNEHFLLAFHDTCLLALVCWYCTKTAFLKPQTAVSWQEVAVADCQSFYRVKPLPVYVCIDPCPSNLNIMLCLRSQHKRGLPLNLTTWCIFIWDNKSTTDRACKRTEDWLDTWCICYSTCVEPGLHNECTPTCCTALIHLTWLDWVIFPVLMCFSSRRAAWTCAAFQWWGCLHWDPQSLQQLQWHRQCSRWR